MCGRYVIQDTRDWRPIWDALNRSPLAARFPRGSVRMTPGDVCPSDVAPVIASNRAGEKTVFPMKWGFSGKTLLINARTETASLKPTFREAWAAHRCIVPASSYYEWEHLTGPDGKKKTGAQYILRPKDAAMTWLCGLYRMEDGLPHFVILTREAAGELRFIHDRMPLMLPEQYINDWINPASRPEDLISAAEDRIGFEKTAG